jgi:hypothetical protein
MIVIERSRVDDRWCVASRYRETLCRGWFVPAAVVVAVICWPLDRARARRLMAGLKP